MLDIFCSFDSSHENSSLQQENYGNVDRVFDRSIHDIRPAPALHPCSNAFINIASTFEVLEQ